MYAVGIMTHLCYSEIKMLYAKFHNIHSYPNWQWTVTKLDQHKRTAPPKNL